jgi:phosphatidylglycerol lysyltransferase
VLYRLFEFWLPLIAGFISFAWKGRHIFVRLFPAFLVFMLGIINILSVVTPPVASRIRFLRGFLPIESINASNVLVLMVGFVLLIISALLLRGQRSAWSLALILSGISLLGHIAKALDYEEALLAAFVILVLLLSYKQYRLKSKTHLVQLNLFTVALVFAATFVYGFVGFYFLNVRHFGIDFTWQQSLQQALESFLVIEVKALHPVTRFAHEFLLWMDVLGFVCWGLLIIVLLKPFFKNKQIDQPSRERAEILLEQYGNSPVDYFKTYSDKLLFFSDIAEAFIAYRIANGFAIVLEEPVCAEEYKVTVLKEFDDHCRKMSLKTAFYRVDESSVTYFSHLKKRKMLIGQEAVLEVDSFTLEGRDKKSLRNGLNSLQKKGYATQLYPAPLSDEFIYELKQVSDEWLEYYDKKELVFSQGMFVATEIKKQDVIAVRNAEGSVKAFLNIIPDFAPDECTYDMIRKTADAPGGCMDALIIELVKYARERHLHYLNLGLVPMAGIEQPDNTAEQLMQYAYEKIKRFRQYSGLREFKEKYASVWLNKYLIYENDFDLLQLPVALNKVMQPRINT